MSTYKKIALHLQLKKNTFISKCERNFFFLITSMKHYYRLILVIVQRIQLLFDNRVHVLTFLPRYPAFITHPVHLDILFRHV